MKSRIDNPEALGKAIRLRRRELGMTQTHLADVAGTTPRFVSELENGKRTAQVEWVFRVLAALGISLEATWR